MLRCGGSGEFGLVICGLDRRVCLSCGLFGERVLRAPGSSTAKPWAAEGASVW